MKKVAVINDMSGFGKCSLSASIAILSAMGLQPCAMPTAVLTNQTEFNNHYCVDLTDSMPRFIEMWSKNCEEFDGIYSGYVANEKQIDIINNFITKFNTNSTRVLVDPVMGDNGKLYPAYSPQICLKMKDLVKRADIITPNLTELCIIADKDYSKLVAQKNSQNYIEQIFDIAKSAISHIEQQIVVTGIKKDGYLYNGVFSRNKSFVEKSEEIGPRFSGTGDIFASVVCGDIINGNSTEHAVQTATNFVKLAVLETVKEPYDPNYGVNFEKILSKLC